MESADVKTQYSVQLLSATCTARPNCLPHCMEKECLYLCRHMISCTCYDFTHGHLCKHCHKVHHLHRTQLPTCNELHQVDPVLDDPCINTNEDEVSVQEIGVHPPKRVQNEVGKCCPTHTHIHIIMHLLFERVIYMTLCRLFTN